MDTFDDELFEGGWEKVKLSRSQKREARQKYWEPKAEEEADVSTSHITPYALDIGSCKMQTLQETDTSLNAARKAAEENSCSNAIGFFNLMLYHLD